MEKKYWGIVVCLCVLLATYIIGSAILDFVKLPSPLYGGDYYYQLAGVYNTYEGNIFGSINGLGSSPGYLPLYSIAVTVVGKLFHLDPLDAMVLSNFIWPALSILITSTLLFRILKQPALAIIGTFVLVNLYSFPIFKYAEFTQLIIVPLFFLAVYEFYLSSTTKNAIILGGAFGLMGLSHGTSFFYAGFMVVALFIFKTFIEKQDWKRIVPYFALISCIGIIFFLQLWFDPIFVYHGQGGLLNNIFAFPDVADLGIGIEILLWGLGKMFLNLSNPLTLLISVATAYGVYNLFRKKDEEHIFLKFAFVSTFIFIYSYLLTAPLFGIHMVPTISQIMFLSPIAMIIGLVALRDISLKYSVPKVILTALLILVFWNLVSGYEAWQESNALAQLSFDHIPQMKNIGPLQTYLLANTSIDDVILSNNGQSFMLNAISGRKIVVSRRSQNDPFMQDFDQRQIDAAIMLYGNNLSKRLELIDKYEVKYLYYDEYWPAMEFMVKTENGENTLAGYIDPLLAVFSMGREIELENNGVRYSRVHSYIDPVMRDANIRKFNILIVRPENYNLSGKGIWQSEIDEYLTPVWMYSENGKIKSVLYEVG